MPIYTGDKFGFGKAPEDGGGAVQSGEAFFPEPGQYDWVCPAGVTKVCAVCIGGGGGATRDEMGGAGGGGLGYKNDITVEPGQTYKIQVGAGGVGDVYMQNYGTSGGDSWFINATTVKGGGGGGTGCGADGDHTVPGYGGRGGTYVGDGGGNGGNGGDGNRSSITGTGADTGGGGAGGYGGDGGKGGDYNGNWQSGSAGNNGAGGGGCTAAGGSNEYWGGGGGGVTVYGKGRNGGTGSDHNYDWQSGGIGGSGGAAGWGNGGYSSGYGHVSGGQYGGGGGSTDQRGGAGASGAVRLIWGTGRSFPNVGADDFWSEMITRYTASSTGDPTTTSSNWFRGGLGEEDNGNYGSNYNYNGIVPNIQSHTNLTGDLTVECWIYVERLADNTQTFGSSTDGWGSCIMDGRGTGNSSGAYLGSWWISRGNSRRGSTGPYFLNYGASSSPSSTMTSDTECIQQCTWHHVAITRQNNVWWMWVDGVKVKASGSPGAGGEGSTPETLQAQNDRPVIGGWGYGGRMHYWSFFGNISNFRITKGAALYDGSSSTYTVPTFPLTTDAPSGASVECLTCGVDDDYEKDLTGSRVWSGPNCMPSVLGPGAPTEEVVKKGYRIWGRHRGLGGGTKNGQNGSAGDGGLLSTWKRATGSFQTEQFGTHGGWSAQSHTADGVSIKVMPKGAYSQGDNAGAKWNLKSISYGVPTYRPRNNSLGFGPFIPNVQIKVMSGKNSGDTVIYDSGQFTLRLPSYNQWDSNTGTQSKERYTSCAFEIELPNGGATDLDMDSWYSVYIKGLVHPNVNNWNSTNGTPGSNKQNFWYPESPVSYSANSGTYNEMRYAPKSDNDEVEVRLEAANFNDTSWASNNHGDLSTGQFPFFGISMPINFMKDPLPVPGAAPAQEKVFHADCWNSSTTYDFVVPAGVTSICVICVGGGGAGEAQHDGASGGGGGLAYKNNITVTPGETIVVTVGAGGFCTSNGITDAPNGKDSYITVGGVIYARANGGRGGDGNQGNEWLDNSDSFPNVNSDGGGHGGCGVHHSGCRQAGGGAGGYAGGGQTTSGYAAGNYSVSTTNAAGSGGGGGGGYSQNGSSAYYTAGGGGTGIYGQGANGAAGDNTNTPSNSESYCGRGGSPAHNTGLNGYSVESPQTTYWGTATGASCPSGQTQYLRESNIANYQSSNHSTPDGGFPGGGGGGSNSGSSAGWGGNGVVRIIWGTANGVTRAFPSTGVDKSDQYPGGSVETPAGTQRQY